MSEIKKLHRTAMEHTDLAILAKRQGNNALAKEHFESAYSAERNAALIVKDDIDNEPTRSILFRSAASLALDCDNTSEAEKLICWGLTGNPPEDIANELRDLLEQVYFKRHLSLKGIKLAEDEIQMSISGEGVGFGIAPTTAFMNRVEKTEALLIRTAERKKSRPYRDKGRHSKSIQESVELFMSVPRAASFAVTFRVGSKDQMDLPGLSSGSSIVEEMLECLELYAKGENDELKKKINDEAYYKNFVGLARILTPDGEEVTQVGFTRQKEGKIKEVSLINQNENTDLLKQSDISGTKNIPDQKPKSIEITGILKFADSVTSKKDKIRIVDDHSKTHMLIVPEGMMSDIVKPLWESRVNVIGIKKGQSYYLDSISEVR